MEDTRLGPFRVMEPIGSGGMAEVWLGRHEREKIPVAIKFVTGDHVHREGFIELFENEVRAVAMMTHRAIIRVFDYGIVDGRDPSNSFLQKRRGLPYLVMDYASLGSLEDVALPLTWGSLRTILRITLDALAHAHARKVVHRDIKPANILLHGATGTGPLIRLSDFGIARPLESMGSGVPEDRGISGTPSYMAPEQFEGAWRDYGPWTDLYALGCVAYQLASGALPFEGTNMVALYVAHQKQPFPRLSAEGYPERFNDWLQRMTAKKPRDRFQCAADAARALALIPGPEESLEGLIINEAWRRSDTDEGHTQIDSSSGQTLLLDGLGEHGFMVSNEVALQGLTPLEQAPNWVPETWRDEERGQGKSNAWFAGTGLTGTGLGLYGLRAIPLVGREGERDRLWEGLKQVARQRRPRLILLEGASGTGKSRLARWLIERAEELGAARTMTGRHFGLPGPQAGFIPMLQRHLNLEGLDRKGVEERLGRLFSDEEVGVYEWAALSALLATGPDEVEGGSGGDGRERASLIERLLIRLGRRPLVMWLDDLQWGAGSLEMITHLLGTEQALPLLILGTVGDDALVSREEEAHLLERLRGHWSVDEIVLGPLEEREHRELVEGLLGLESELATEVVARTAGNPFFAVQLVGDWVERGILEATPLGFVARAGEDLVLPDNLLRLWEQRLDHLLGRHSEDCAIALEIAAVMGQEIDSGQWMMACELGGNLPTPELIRDLVEQRFIIGTKEHWSFAHGMLRETIEQRAREAGRLREHHRVISEMLLTHHIPGMADIDERLATHLVACGLEGDAASLYLSAARDADRRSDYARTLYLSRRGLEALEAGEVVELDPRYGEFGALRAAVFDARIMVAESGREMEALRGRFAAPGWSGVWARCMELEARGLRKNGDLVEGEALFEQARQMYARAGDENGIARCLEGKAWSLVLSGKLDEAEQLYELATTRFAGIDEQRVIADCLNGMSEILRRRRRYAQAVAMLERGVKLCQGIRYSRGLLDCMNSLAEIRRDQGELDLAQALYEEVIELAATIGMGRVAIGEVNLALVQLARGHYAQAQSVFENLLEWMGDTENRTMRAALYASLCTCHGARGDWSMAESYLQKYRALFVEEALFDPDLAGCLEIGAELAIQQHCWAEARALFELALDQWRGLDSKTRVQVLEQRLAALA